MDGDGRLQKATRQNVERDAMIESINAITGSDQAMINATSLTRAQFGDLCDGFTAELARRGNLALFDRTGSPGRKNWPNVDTMRALLLVLMYKRTPMPQWPIGAFFRLGQAGVRAGLRAADEVLSSILPTPENYVEHVRATGGPGWQEELVPDNTLRIENISVPVATATERRLNRTGGAARGAARELGYAWTGGAVAKKARRRARTGTAGKSSTELIKEYDVMVGPYDGTRKDLAREMQVVLGLVNFRLLWDKGKRWRFG